MAPHAYYSRGNIRIAGGTVRFGPHALAVSSVSWVSPASVERDTWYTFTSRVLAVVLMLAMIVALFVSGWWAFAFLVLSAATMVYGIVGKPNVSVAALTLTNGTQQEVEFPSALAAAEFCKALAEAMSDAGHVDARTLNVTVEQQRRELDKG